jgi:hypothetical protein
MHVYLVEPKQVGRHSRRIKNKIPSGFRVKLELVTLIIATHAEFTQRRQLHTTVQGLGGNVPLTNIQ